MPAITERDYGPIAIILLFIGLVISYNVTPLLIGLAVSSPFWVAGTYFSLKWLISWNKRKDWQKKGWLTRQAYEDYIMTQRGIATPQDSRMSRSSGKSMQWHEVETTSEKTSRTYIDPNGYRRYSDSDRLVHIHIAEVYVVRRKLRDDEVVHHLNGNKLDNRAENLRVMTWREHRDLHER